MNTIEITLQINSSDELSPESSSTTPLSIANDETQSPGSATINNLDTVDTNSGGKLQKNAHFPLETDEMNVRIFQDINHYYYRKIKRLII